MSDPDFANDEGVEILGTLEIPAGLYPGTNFSGGELAVSVSTAITNLATCSQFGSGAPDRNLTFHGVMYSVFSTRRTAGMGHWQDRTTLHTYKNGFCYEFMFAIHGYEKANLDDPSSVREFNQGPRIQRNLLSRISFSEPIAKPTPPMTGHSEVLSFLPSSDVAGAGIHSNVTFSWTSRNVDYVRLEFSCPKGAVILMEGAGAPCAGDSSSANQSPDGSKAVIFGNSILDSPERAPIGYRDPRTFRQRGHARER